MISPSILSADFTRLGEEIEAVTQAGADWIHVDVMDGHFVPNLTIGPLVVAAARRASRLPLDVHLMIESPERYVADFVRAGAAYLTVHQEACPRLRRVLDLIRGHGARPGVAINPPTPLEAVEGVLDAADLLLVMSVNPGFPAQEFIDVTTKLAAARELRERRGLNYLIEVDGGVKVHNAGLVGKAGAEVLVAGSAVFKSEDYRATISGLRAAAEGKAG